MAFYKNIQSNPYTFCLRGAGNFSIRFFETLAMGRIPVIIDTDNRLPLHTIINWNRHCVFTNGDDFVTDLINFHKCISPLEFKMIQKNNRALWENYLTRENYFIQIHSIIQNEV